MMKVFVPEAVRVHEGDPVRQFAELLKWEFTRVGWAPNRIARAIGCPSSLVEDWLTGAEIPDGLRWKKIIGMISHNLQTYSPLRLQAVSEHAKRQHNRTIGGEERLNPLAAKLARVIPQLAIVKAPAPEPKTDVNEMLRMALAQSDEEQLVPRYEEPEQPDEPPSDEPQSDAVPTSSPPTNKPIDTSATEDDDMSQTAKETKSKRAPNRFEVLPGSRSKEAVNERLAWAREVWLREPDLAVQAQHGGSDGMIPRLRKQFGTGCDVATLGVVKKKTLAELEKLGTPDGVPADQKLPGKRKGPKSAGSGGSGGAVQRVAGDKIDEETLQSAGLLILEAIPNLAEYTLRVNDGGEVEVSYSIRKVVESTGSLMFARPPVKAQR